MQTYILFLYIEKKFHSYFELQISSKRSGKPSIGIQRGKATHFSIALDQGEDTPTFSSQ